MIFDLQWVGPLSDGSKLNPDRIQTHDTLNIKVRREVQIVKGVLQ